MGSVGTPLPVRENPATLSREYAESLDAKDPLREFRDKFIIPSKRDLVRETIVALENGECDTARWDVCISVAPLPGNRGPMKQEVLVKLTLS
jgi:hypothetical protein